MDMGGYVVVINADKVVVSGNKAADKTYFNHVNGRPGSYRMETFQQLQAVRGAWLGYFGRLAGLRGSSGGVGWMPSTCPGCGF